MPTTQKQKKIPRCNLEELRDFAELVLQLNVPAGASRAQVLALITPAWPNDYVFVDEANLDEPDETQNDEARAEAQQKLVTGDSRDDPKWLIRIGATELPGGKDPVPVGVNGRVVIIQRGVEVETPHRYVEALRNAVRVSVHQDPKTQEFSYSNFTNYPFEVLERPSRAEIEEFNERTKDLLLV